MLFEEKRLIASDRIMRLAGICPLSWISRISVALTESARFGPAFRTPVPLDATSPATSAELFLMV